MINSPPSASRHARRRAQTRNLLVQSALALVLERGYEATTIQDITERADLGRGTFYIHFKDKEEAVWRPSRTCSSSSSRPPTNSSTGGYHKWNTTGC